MVLGTIFLITKTIKTNRDFFAKDSYWILTPILIFILIIIDGVISRFDAVLLLLLMGAYILFLLKETTGIISYQIEELGEDIKDDTSKDFAWSTTIPLLIAGIILVIIGAKFTIDSASDIARGFGISEWIIGIIMISLGTSLPELVVSITAATKGKIDMVIGNIIGSNMANITIVLAAAALTNPMKIDITPYIFDIATMFVATLMLLFLTANRLYSKPAGIGLFIVLGLFLEHTIRAI